MAGKPIIVGTDGSEDSMRAVEWAAREAALRGSPLRIVSVPQRLVSWHQPQGTRGAPAKGAHQSCACALASAAERVAQLEPARALDTQLLSGRPARTLAETTAGASMLVIGSRGAGGRCDSPGLGQSLCRNPRPVPRRGQPPGDDFCGPGDRRRCRRPGSVRCRARVCLRGGVPAQREADRCPRLVLLSSRPGTRTHSDCCGVGSGQLPPAVRRNRRTAARHARRMAGEVPSRGNQHGNHARASRSPAHWSVCLGGPCRTRPAYQRA
jgi:nucleotide-binding universal stress UspA family protein